MAEIDKSICFFIVITNAFECYFNKYKKDTLSRSSELGSKKYSKITDRIYYEDSRVAYYADRGYPSMPLITEVMKNKNHIDSYDYFVIESDLKNNFFLTMDGRK